MKTKMLSNKLSRIARLLDTTALDMVVSPNTYGNATADNYVSGIIDSAVQELQELKKWVNDVDTQ